MQTSLSITGIHPRQLWDARRQGRDGIEEHPRQYELQKKKYYSEGERLNQKREGTSHEVPCRVSSKPN